MRCTLLNVGICYKNRAKIPFSVNNLPDSSACVRNRALKRDYRFHHNDDNGSLLSVLGEAVSFSVYLNACSVHHEVGFEGNSDALLFVFVGF